MSAKAMTIAEMELAGALVPVLRDRKAHKVKGVRREDLARYVERPGAPPPVVVEGDGINAALLVGLDALAVKPGWGTCATEGCGLVYELVEPYPGAKVPKTCPACRIKVRGECARKCGKPATHGPHCWAHRQTVCAGAPGAASGCPNRAVPPSSAFEPRCVKERNGEPWRCRSCIYGRPPAVCAHCGRAVGRQASRRAEAEGVKVYCRAHIQVPRRRVWPCSICGAPAIDRRGKRCEEHLTAHGEDRLPCAVCGKPSTNASRWRVRKGLACRAYCPDHKWGKSQERTLTVDGEARRSASAERRRNVQAECAGWRGACPHHASPPPHAFNPLRVAKRRGAPWRCRSCGNRAGAAKRHRQ